GFASDLPTELNFYSNNYNPISSNRYYYSVNDPLTRSAFSGWSFAVPAGDSLQVKNTDCDIFPIGKNGAQASVFTVASNGSHVILHPNIPANYFDGAHTCSATVALYNA